MRGLTAIALLTCGCAPDEVKVEPPPATDVEIDMEIVDVNIVEDAAMPHHVTFEIVLSEPAMPGVVCDLVGDPDEVLTFAATESSESPSVELVGLLADETYSCRVESNSVSVDVELNTGPLGLDFVPRCLGDTSADDMAGVYTLYNHFATGEIENHKLLIVDPECRVRFSLDVGATDTGGVEFTALGPNLLRAGGGERIHPTTYALTGELVDAWPAPTAGGLFHHDVVDLPDDTTAALVTTVDAWPAGFEFTGFAIEIRESSSLDPVWIYNSQDGFDDLEPTVLRPDPYHANAMSFLDDDRGSAVWLSLKNQNNIVRLDRQTEAVDLRLGPGGDFVLQNAAGEPLPDDEWFWGQHDPDFHLPSVFIYDNGSGRPNGQNYSRAVELVLDMVSEPPTATLAWEWREPGWYETVFGDVDLLENNHVLIAQGHCYFCGVGDPDRRSAVVELDRDNGQEVWRLSYDEEEAGIYRADRVGGCDLFTNRKYCPEL